MDIATAPRCCRLRRFEVALDIVLIVALCGDLYAHWHPPRPRPRAGRCSAFGPGGGAVMSAPTPNTPKAPPCLCAAALSLRSADREGRETYVCRTCGTMALRSASW